jgi:phosphatidate cytidylyltransferase
LAALTAETLRRTRAALVMLAVVAAALWADYHWLQGDILFSVVLSVATVWAYSEFCDICEAWGIKPFRVWGMAGCLALLWLHWMTLPHSLSAPRQLPRGVLDAGLVILIFAVFLRQGFVKETHDALAAVSMTLLGVLYLWFLPSFLVRIRHLGGAEWLSVGNGLLISTVVLSKISDVGAYFVGRHFGRHKLIPRISPAKSVEGAVAGLASSVGAAYACSALGLLPGIPGWAVPAFGLVAGLAGQCGDLMESLFKRSGGVKDSGAAVPGYGGILDVIDSLLITAGPAYFFLRFFGGLEMRG